MRALCSDPGKTCAPFIWNPCRFAENENQVDGTEMTAKNNGLYTLQIAVFGNSYQRAHTSTKPLQPLPSPAAMRAGNDALPNPPHPPSIRSTATYVALLCSVAHSPHQTNDVLFADMCKNDGAPRHFLRTHVKIMTQAPTFLRVPCSRLSKYCKNIVKI